MENTKQRSQKTTAHLTATLLTVIRQNNWPDEVRQQAAQAVQDNYLAGNSKAVEFELKAGTTLTIEYDYPGIHGGFALQMSWDEDRAIALGNCGGRRAYTSKRSSFLKEIDLTKGEYLAEQSSRIQSFLNE